MSTDPKKIFHSADYLFHNEKRLEHLKSLDLSITAGMTVLEVGAGVGDHTSFFIDRGCVVTTTDGRAECYETLKQRVGDKAVVCQLDLENPISNPAIDKKFDIVYCYGTLYHLSNPEFVLEYLSNRCEHMLLLETCVSSNTNKDTNICKEKENIHNDPSQSVSGYGCRPTRLWLASKLKTLFEYVYMPITQPNHSEFPENWLVPSLVTLSRSVFVCSRELLQNPLLTTTLPMIQPKYSGA